MEKESSKLACLYARVSSELQEEMQTIKSQIDELERVIKANGDTLVAKYIDDGYSGELLERPELDKLRDDARKGIWSKVYILSPDRLARKAHIAGLIIEELRSKEIEVLFINRPLGNTIEDELLFNIQSIFADYEKSKYKERQRRGKMYKARRQSIVGNKPPYGYNYIADAKSRTGRYEINEKESGVVKLIYDLYTNGNYRGYRSIVKELYNRRVKTRSGREIWSQATISHVLSDETYVGTTYYNKRYRCPPKSSSQNGKYKRMKNTARAFRNKVDWIPIPVPAIVSSELFIRAQLVKKQNTLMSARNTKQNYLLKNLMKCVECGMALYAYFTGDKRRTYCFYQCSFKSRQFPIPTQHRLTVGRDKTDSTVWDALKDALASPRALAARINLFNKQQRGARGLLQTKLESATRKLKDLEIKRQRMIDAYSEQAITFEEFRIQTVNYNEEKENLMRAKSEIETELSRCRDNITARDVSAIIIKYKRALHNATFEIKRNLVKEIVREILVNEKEKKLIVNCELPPMMTSVPIPSGIAFAPFL